MKEQKGYVSIYRTITENWVWDDKPFSRGQAWVDLLLLANHKDIKFSFRGKVIHGKRGSVYRSITYLAERWGWSRSKATRFLKQLEADKMVRLEITTHLTTIVIEKYEDYQSGSVLKTFSKNERKATDEQQTDSRRADEGQSEDTYNNDNNEDNKNNEEEDDWFEKL